MSSLPIEKLSSAHELLDAEAHMWNHIFSFINPMCLKCAIELGIPDIIHKHGKPMTLSELTEALPINKAKSFCIGRLMRVLVRAKFFTKVKISEEEEDEGNMGFLLTPAYRRFLISDDDLSMASFVRANLDHDLVNPCHYMSRWFQNDHPHPFRICHGMTLWDNFGLNPKLGQLFNEGMASDTRLVSRIVPNGCKEVFEGLELMVDVGGGTGFMAKAISDSFPGLKCIVLDLPQVVNGLEGNDKVAFVGGDMFEFIPPCDAVSLKWILHDWSDEECLKILNNCRVAINPSKNEGAKVIVMDMVVCEEEEEEEGDHKAMETQLFFDMWMMITINGRERTEKEWANLFSQAGFTSYKITPLLGLRSLIEVFP